MNTITSQPLASRRTSWALAAVLVVLGGAGLWAINHGAHAADDSKKGDKSPEPPVAVTTAPVKQQDVPVLRAGIGTVTAAQSVTVKARVDGQLDKIGFEEGQDVKAGQLLARIDPRALQAQLLQAQATRAKDQATLVNARVDLQRYATLIAQDAATQQQLDTQKALVAQLEATVKNDDAALAYAQVQLDYTRITAPIGGRAGARLVDVGNIVHATDTTGIVVINQIDPITALFTLPEDAVQQINDAQNRTQQPLIVYAYPRDSDTLLAAGKLVVLNNQIDTTTGTVQLKASFANPRHLLWPGQFVNMRLVLGTRKQALTIPAAAVQRSQDGVYTYVIDPATKTASVKTISVAMIQDGTAVIDGGLSAGQRVVVDGQYKLKPGSHVVEVPRGSASTPAGAGASAATVAAGDKK